MNTFPGNPIDRLKPLADARIPVICVCGDSDRVVPFSENSAVVRQRYTAMGAPFELILKPGVDHHPHSLENPTPVVDFIVRHPFISVMEPPRKATVPTRSFSNFRYEF